MKDVVAVIFENEIYHCPPNLHSFHVPNILNALPLIKMSSYYSTGCKARILLSKLGSNAHVFLGFSSAYIVPFFFN